MARGSARRKGVLGAIGLVTAFVAGSVFVGQFAMAAGGPADKTAAIGNTVDDFGPDTDHVVLQEQMRVSSPQDLILNVSSECAIITQLVTGATRGTSTDEAHTAGQVDLYLTIDGKRVPVAGDASGNGDNGTVTFCNQSRGRQVVDNENNTPMDGQDRIADYNSAKAANAFQWLALNVGTAYDNVALNGQNILDIQLHAIYADTDASDCDALRAGNPSTYDTTCSEAFIGKRTLIVEPTHASVTETTDSSTDGK